MAWIKRFCLKKRYLQNMGALCNVKQLVPDARTWLKQRNKQQPQLRSARSKQHLTHGKIMREINAVLMMAKAFTLCASTNDGFFCRTFKPSFVMNNYGKNCVSPFVISHCLSGLSLNTFQTTVFSILQIPEITSFCSNNPFYRVKHYKLCNVQVDHFTDGSIRDGHGVLSKKCIQE